MKGQYSGDVICLDQSEARIQVKSQSEASIIPGRVCVLPEGRGHHVPGCVAPALVVVVGPVRPQRRRNRLAEDDALVHPVQ